MPHYANAHRLSTGRICLSINTYNDDTSANITLFNPHPSQLRDWADALEALYREKEIEDRVKSAIAAEANHD